MRKADWIAGGVGGAMLLGAAAVFGVTHYNALLHPGANQAANAGEQPGLNFPSIDEMCKAAGATAANRESCVNDETSAAEFVGAWMQYNGFLTDGRIDIQQIQLQAELSASDHTIDPPAGDPTGSARRCFAGCRSCTGPRPVRGCRSAGALGRQKMPPAQVALYCLTAAADDWLKMHDCITQNDPSSSLDGN